jgi:FlgD Ig-like domain
MLGARLTRLGASTLLLTSTLWSSPTPAESCTCYQITPAETFARATFVFVGTVVAEELPSSMTNTSADKGGWRFTVSRGWKGAPTEEVTIYSGLDTGMCGYRFEVGDEYLVYAYVVTNTSGNWPEGTQFPVLATASCSRTRITEQAGEDFSYLGVPLWQSGVPTPPFVLRQNRPNPFNPLTTIPLDLNESRHVSLIVYDIAGRRIRVLAEGVLAAGRHDVPWDGKDTGSRAVASGVYVYELCSSGECSRRPMVLAR